MKGVKGFQKGHKHSEETKKKISAANNRQVKFNCDYCGKESADKLSSFNKKKGTSAADLATPNTENTNWSFKNTTHTKVLGKLVNRNRSTTGNITKIIR